MRARSISVLGTHPPTERRSDSMVASIPGAGQDATV